MGDSFDRHRHGGGPERQSFFASLFPGPLGDRAMVDVSGYGELSNDFSRNRGRFGRDRAQLFGDVEGSSITRTANPKSRRPAHNGINGGALTAALADPNPVTALNVFGGPNNRATLDA